MTNSVDVDELIPGSGNTIAASQEFDDEAIIGFDLKSLRAQRLWAVFWLIEGILNLRVFNLDIFL